MRPRKRHQRPGEPRREEVRDEQRGEDHHRLDEARGAAGCPERERDDGHHDRGHERAHLDRHAATARGHDQAEGAPDDGEEAKGEREHDVAAVGAGSASATPPKTPVADPHQSGREIRQRAVVPRIAIGVERRLRLSLKPSMVVKNIGFLSIDLKAMSGHSKWASIKHKKKAVDAKRARLHEAHPRDHRGGPRGRGDPDGTRLWHSRFRRRATPRCRRTTSSARLEGDRRTPTRTPSRRFCTRATAPAGWRSSSRRSPITATARLRGAERLHKARRQSRRAGLGGLDLREEGRDRGGWVALLGGRPAVAIDAGAEDVALDGDIWEIVTGPAELAAVRRAIEDAGVRDRVGRTGPEAHHADAGRGGPGRHPDAPDRRARGERRRAGRARELRRGRRGARAGGRRVRIAAAVFWMFAGAMHFVIPRQYQAIVPPSIARWKKEVGWRAG